MIRDFDYNSLIFKGAWIAFLFFWGGFFRVSSGSAAQAFDPEIKVDFAVCDPRSPEYLCENLPTLLIAAELKAGSGEEVNVITGKIGSRSFSCTDGLCRLALAETSNEGDVIEYWVTSKSGKSTEHYYGRVRVVDYANLSGYSLTGYRTELLSDHYHDQRTICCTQLWTAFYPIENIPNWLVRPVSDADLQTSNPYYFLAGRLISYLFVDARECANNGVLSNGYADECGLQKALERVVVWQNRYDPYIYQSGLELGIPPWLLKNLIAYESQFWPGDFGTFQEYGLGHMTELGADTLFIWNRDFFVEFCKEKFSTGGFCSLGYSNMTSSIQGMLRGLLAENASAYCMSCDNGLDLSDSDYKVEVVSNALLANAIQTSQIVYLTTSRPAGVSLTYDDLWRLTLVNYTSGPGCLSSAVRDAWVKTRDISWQNLSGYLTEGCDKAIDYVDTIAP